MIQWIFFDVGSTLVDESEGYKHQIDDAIHGTPISYNRFYDTMMAYYKQSKKGDLEAFKHFHLTEPVWHAEDERLFPDTEECLERLSKHYKIGIIANQSAGTADRLAAFGITKYISLIIASAEEGISKPDLRIFGLALERAGCKPENAVMVGDRLENDIAPANQIGMKTIWIKQGFGQYSVPASTLEQADYITESLTDVCNILLAEK